MMRVFVFCSLYIDFEKLGIEQTPFKRAKRYHHSMTHLHRIFYSKNIILKTIQMQSNWSIFAYHYCKSKCKLYPKISKKLLYMHSKRQIWLNERLICGAGNTVTVVVVIVFQSKNYMYTNRMCVCVCTYVSFAFI